MSKQIDWSKAPEGATHYYPPTEEWYLAGYGCAPLVWTGMWCKAFQFAQREHKCIERPTTPSWSGEGLPPVGVVCDVFNRELSNPEWEKCTILFAGKHRFLYDSESCAERCGYIENLEFRPIRTPEQIESDARIKAAQEWLKSIELEYGEDVADQCENILMAAEEKRMDKL